MLNIMRFRAAKMRIHPVKCHWAATHMKFLEHVVNVRVVSVDTDEFSIIEGFPVPDTMKSSVVSYDFSTITEDLLRHFVVKFPYHLETC